jgi:hypothetical protein
MNISKLHRGPVEELRTPSKQPPSIAALHLRDGIQVVAAAEPEPPCGLSPENISLVVDTIPP